VEYSKTVFLHNEIQIFDDCGLRVEQCQQAEILQSLGWGIITVLGAFYP